MPYHGGGGSGIVTPVSLANGGTGSALVDPNADRIFFWDDSAGATAFLTAGSGLSISGTTITATATGDVVGPASATSNALAVFDGTTGKLIKNSSITQDANTPVFAFTNAGTVNRLIGDSDTTVALTLDAGYGSELKFGLAQLYLGSNAVWQKPAGTTRIYTSDTNSRWGASMLPGFSSDADASAAALDTTFFRAAAGVMGVGGATGTAAGTLRVQAASGGYVQEGTNTELITLDTGALVTDSTANLLPANSIIDAVTARVTTTITTSTDWAVGDPTTAARFSSANATLAAGTTSVGLNHQQGSVATDATGPVQIAAAKVRITVTGANPGAGAIRVTVHYRTFVAPTS